MVIFNTDSHSNPLENSDPIFVHKLSLILKCIAIPKRTAFDFCCAFVAWSCRIFEVTSSPAHSVIPDSFPSFQFLQGE